jgi:hypothetical protein
MRRRREDSNEGTVARKGHFAATVLDLRISPFSLFCQILELDNPRKAQSVPAALLADIEAQDVFDC